MYTFVTSEIQKRVITNVNHQWEITDYGFNNLYPQLMDELFKRSPLTKQAIKVLTEFCMGEGWKGNGDKVINRYGQTFNDMLRLASEDLNTFSGYALHCNFNALGRIVEVQHIPFEYVRLGTKDLQGITNNVKVFNNWEQDSVKFNTYKGIEPTTYPIFNPKTAAEDALTGGNGQVLYWTPHMFSYPLASFDAIRDAVQTDAEIQEFMLSKVMDGFLGTTLFKYPGGFDSEEERRKVEYKLKQMKGAKGARFILAVTPEDFDSNLIEPIPAPNDDSLFTNTSEKVVNTILQNFSVPGPLLAVNPQGSVFTQEQIRDSYILMNLRTANKRKMLERAFEPIGKLFGVRLGAVKEIPWEIPGQNMPKPNGDPNQLEKEPEEKPKKEEETKEEAKLLKLYG